MAKRKTKWTEEELKAEAKQIFLDDYECGQFSDYNTLKGLYEDGEFDMSEEEFRKFCNYYLEFWS